MAPCSHKNLKVKMKDVKIPHLMNANKKKMEAWGLGGLFAVEWSRTYEDLVEELAGHPDQKVAVPKYEYRGKQGAWISNVWREVYNLPKASPRDYVMKGKVQFTELQLLRLVKGDKQQSKFGVFLEKIEGDFDFVLFCHMLNSVLAAVRPEHFQHNQIAFYHYAWVAINDPTAPTPDWGDAVEKIVSM
ncbi:hypothetical protein R1flu_027010 [Riccia fluitans]|uniref:Uncharacterized protein n=1 Tax=Riccia fluitans TaxID=41844 RepID=A0ABD1XHJ4_9MARC